MGHVGIILSVIVGAVNAGLIPIFWAAFSWPLLISHGVLEYMRASALAEELSKTTPGINSDKDQATVQHMWYRSDQPTRNKVVAVIFIVAAFLLGLGPIVTIFSDTVGSIILVAAGACYVLIAISILTASTR